VAFPASANTSRAARARPSTSMRALDRRIVPERELAAAASPLMRRVSSRWIARSRVGRSRFTSAGSNVGFSFARKSTNFRPHRFRLRLGARGWALTQRLAKRNARPAARTRVVSGGNESSATSSPA
jgi:hypothetical protein